MWMVARYAPTALFSLKSAAATSSGGKTLICPTPFAIKMALLDAALRTRGQPAGKQLWPVIQNLRLKIALPDQIAVINITTQSRAQLIGQVSACDAKGMRHGFVADNTEHVSTLVRHSGSPWG